MTEACDKKNNVTEVFGVFCKKFDVFWRGNNWDLPFSTFEAKNFKDLVNIVYVEIASGFSLVPIVDNDTGITKVSCKKERIVIDVSNISNNIALLVEKHYRHLGYCVQLDGGIFTVRRHMVEPF